MDVKKQCRVGPKPTTSIIKLAWKSDQCDSNYVNGGEENAHKLIYTNKLCTYCCQCSAESKTYVVDLPSYDNILFTWQPLVGVLNSKGNKSLSLSHIWQVTY